MSKYFLDKQGLIDLWEKIKNHVSSSIGNGTITIKQGSTTQTFTTNQSADKTITLTDNNTDTKVTNTLATTTKAYVTGTTSATTNTGTQVFDTGVYLDTTAGQLTATTFKGKLTGNADTATKATTATTATSATSATSATMDASGNTIASTYIKGLSVSGKVITYTKGNGTTGTITTQDTTYSVATTEKAGLLSPLNSDYLDNLKAQPVSLAPVSISKSGTTISVVRPTATFTEPTASTSGGTTINGNVAAFNLKQGSNVTLAADTATKTITISATNTTYSAATTSANGLMSATDKKKLDAMGFSTTYASWNSGSLKSWTNGLTILSSQTSKTGFVLRADDSNFYILATSDGGSTYSTSPLPFYINHSSGQVIFGGSTYTAGNASVVGTFTTTGSVSLGADAVVKGTLKTTGQNLTMLNSSSATTGAILRTDGNDFYILITTDGGSSYSSLRPFKINYSDGHISINTNLYGNGDVWHFLSTGAGKCTSLTQTTSSDKNNKENLRDFDALGVIEELGDVYQFEYKDTGETSYGLIAQNVQASPLASAVGKMDETNEESLLYLNYLDPRFIAISLKAIKELSAKVATLETKIQELENK